MAMLSLFNIVLLTDLKNVSDLLKSSPIATNIIMMIHLAMVSISRQKQNSTNAEGANSSF